MLDSVKKLAIHGKAKTGKNTVAKLIQQYCDFDVYETAFAKPIKEELIKLFDINSEYLFGSSEKRQELFDENLSYRELLIQYGEFCKTIDPKIWIKKTEKDILYNVYNVKYKQPKDIIIDQQSLCLNTSFIPFDYKLIVITDLRFKREFDWLKKQNFKLLKLTRKNNDYFNNDLSETELDEMADNLFDYHMDNDGNLDELAQKVRHLITIL